MAELIFWLNTPSMHMAPLIRAVTPLWEEARGGPVTVVTETRLSPERRAMGWEEADFAPARLCLAPDARTREALITAATGSGDLHLFSGIDAYPGVHAAFRRVAGGPARAWVISERPRDDDGWRARARRAKYAALARRHGPGIETLLAIGSRASATFRAAGFAPDRVFDFAYFTDPPVAAPSRPSPSRAIRLLYLGQLQPWKGVDLLIEALGAIGPGGWRLDLVGAGPELGALTAAADRAGISQALDWQGARPQSEARSALAAADLLVLPSRYDGWGAVVNEALQAGTPVVASANAGASDLVEASGEGAVVAAGDARALAAALGPLIARGPLPPETRRSLAGWASHAIAPEAGARYLMALIAYREGGPRPSAPWAAAPSPGAQR